MGRRNSGPKALSLSACERRAAKPTPPVVGRHKPHQTAQPGPIRRRDGRRNGATIPRRWPFQSVLALSSRERVAGVITHAGRARSAPNRAARVRANRPSPHRLLGVVAPLAAHRPSRVLISRSRRTPWTDRPCCPTGHRQLAVAQRAPLILAGCRGSQT